jgi:hypothetical protein
MSGSPFNSCDYLCEECSETENCKVFALLREKALSKRLSGAVRNGAVESLEDVKESLDETIELLNRMATELGMSLEGTDEVDDLEQNCIDNDDLYQLSLAFTMKTHAFLKRIEPFVKSESDEAFRDAVWYHTMVSVKTHRAIASDYDGLSEDAMDSAAVAIKSLTKCIEAFRLIGKDCSPASRESGSLSKTALEIRRQVRRRFSPALLGDEGTEQESISHADG